MILMRIGKNLDCVMVWLDFFYFSIPIYSAYKIMRDPNQGTNKRPDSNWHHVCFGLCLDEDDFDFSAVADQSFYSNIDQCDGLHVHALSL